VINYLNQDLQNLKIFRIKMLNLINYFSGRYRAVLFITVFAFLFLGGPLPAAELKKEKPEEVYTGLYLNNISSINLAENVFMADFYLWFRWQGNIDPVKNLEFTNSYEKWAFNITPAYQDFKNLGGGWKYQVLRVEGKFISKFDLHSYPMDIQYLPIEIEDGTNNSQSLVYLPEVKDSGYSKKLVIPGWEIINQEVTTYENEYETSFGQPDLKKEKYNRFKFLVSIERPQILFLFKTLLPIIVVLLSVFTIFFINPAYFEVRSGITVTALLSAIALQITVSGDLPAVGYMVLIDKVYNLAYLITLMALIETVICEKYKDAGNLEKANTLDRQSFRILSLFTLFSLFLIINAR
jgi:hypothetical protein